MKKFNPFLAVAGFSLITLASGCNGGVNLEVGGLKAESPALENGGQDPAPTPVPSATPGTSPTPNPNVTGKNRIFVSTTLVHAVNNVHRGYFDSVCNGEAQAAQVNGNFAALVATSRGSFESAHTVNGYIYQKSGGAEVRVADHLTALLDGQNGVINTNIYQQTISNSYKNFAWTGQNNFHQPASSDLNCADWSTDQGYGIVGEVGASGSDALATQYQGCHILAHLYCIEVN